jgi:putative ABC transport system substrate-binding protein
LNRRELLILGAAAWPLAAGAQQKPVPVVGFLGIASPGPYAPFVDEFIRGLRETGYVEGQNIAIEYHWANDRQDHLFALAAELVDHKVDVIATSGGSPVAFAVKNATSTIPVVFETGVDPVKTGLVASFAHPGGNLTGICIITTELNPKRFELLSELVPEAKVIALLVNPNNPNTERIVRDVQEAARVRGVQLGILNAGTEGEFDAAFASLARLHAGALLVGNDPLFLSQREQLVALAARDVVPAMYEWREFAAAGGLASYGTSFAGMYRRFGTYVGRILAGAKPADLPVEQPTKFELVINLKTAKVLGLTVPPSIFARADEVIE